MRNARREIPQIADADVIDEIAPLRIDRGDARGAVEHVGPFGRLVPMQLAHAAGIEPHVHAGDVLGNAELAHRHLPGPAARLQAHVRVVERKAQVRQRAVVGRPAARGCPGSGWRGPDSSGPDWCRRGRGVSVAAWLERSAPAPPTRPRARRRPPRPPACRDAKWNSRSGSSSSPCRCHRLCRTGCRRALSARNGRSPILANRVWTLGLFTKVRHAFSVDHVSVPNFFDAVVGI